MILDEMFLIERGLVEIVWNIIVLEVKRACMYYLFTTAALS